MSSADSQAERSWVGFVDLVYRREPGAKQLMDRFNARVRKLTQDCLDPIEDSEAQELMRSVMEVLHKQLPPHLRFLQ